MQVLVDTSVWIHFLANRSPYASRLDALLTDRTVVGHELVEAELLMGDTRGRASLLDNYRLLPYATAVPHDEVVEFVKANRLTGKGIGWIDAQLLASSIVDSFQFWTADRRLNEIAHSLNIDFHA